MSKAKIYDPHFSDRMKLIAETKFGNNHSEFARAVGVAITSLNRWIAGEADPSRSNLIKIAEVSNVSLEWLATGKSLSQAQTPDFSSRPLINHDKLIQVIDVLESILQEQGSERSTTQQHKTKFTQEEIALIQYFRQCSQERKNTLNLLAETLANQTLLEQKENSQPLEDYQVA